MNLIEYIKDHGFECFSDGEVIWAYCDYVKDGIVTRELEQIQPNWKAVREWLGY
jgi:hypothetical protein